MTNKKSKDAILSGNIYGFFPTINTYQGSIGKLEVWSELIKDFVFDKDDKITFSFICDGSIYKVQLRPVNETNYQGRALCDGDDVVKVYYSLYKNSKGYALTGTWVEEDYNYDSLIEIRF